MKKSPVHPKYKSGDYCGYEFDPQVNFAQFLNEARTHSSEGDFGAATPYSGQAGHKQLGGGGGGGQKIKKSWKNSLFSWLRHDKKTKPIIIEPSKDCCSYNTKPRRGYASGPIHGSVDVTTTGKPRGPISGPLTGFFNSGKTMENEIPYMCLDKLNNPHGVQSYGPVYMVT